MFILFFFNKLKGIDSPDKWLISTALQGSVSRKAGETKVEGVICGNPAE